MRSAIIMLCVLGLTGCGVVYHSPTVNTMSRDSDKVRVVEMSSETVMAANRAPYDPQALPAAFRETAGTGRGLRGAGAIPEAPYDPRDKPAGLETRLPPEASSHPYRIGVGDVLLLATQGTASSVDQLSGLLAAANSRQGYTVQDDGVIAIPSVGRVRVSGLTLEEAEAELFQRLVENQFDPTFSLEIAEFNSRKVSIGGAVSNPGVVPVTLTTLYLDEALAQAGGITVTDQDYASVRLYRDGTLYQIPLTELYSRTSLQRIPLIDGDSVFVDTAYDLELAQAYFQQQISLTQLRQSSRAAALSELNAEVSLRRNALNEARENYRSQLEFGAVQRDYVYLTGEIRKQSRYALPLDNVAHLADALYDEGGGLTTTVADVRQIYVLRGSSDPREFGAVTAYQLNGANAANLILATKFELRPNDVIFIAEQPVTRWNRVIAQILPSLNVASRTNSLSNN
ncbi:Polysaccharide biosynthesis/export protein [Pseudooceanicola marinus]|uniref:Polysaccharide biosynthesis/export protein n=1 Tax=Pseudooceanicola marinus TaxID=396013 RepID=A0A1X7AAR9_9RHOB|nr:polysaccharide biosynthesis/export family protein [Pseudooceanicola marinus]SLN74346.1 Polysaccharide biosynthesis/export protein [Pseudooceanicola marinus]